MNGRTVFRVVSALLAVVVVLGIAAYAYQLGIAQGVATADGSPSGVHPYLPYGGPYFLRPWGFGFGGFLFPLLFIFLFFLLLRSLFWRAHWTHGGHPGSWQRGASERFDEWHRKAHESNPTGQ